MNKTSWILLSAALLPMFIAVQRLDRTKREHRIYLRLTGALAALAASGFTVLLRIDVRVAFFALDALWPFMFLACLVPYVDAFSPDPDKMLNTKNVVWGALCGAVGVAHAVALRHAPEWSSTFFGAWLATGLIKH